jgi:hypothetical protein
MPTSAILSSGAQINGLNSPSNLADPDAIDTFQSNSLYYVAGVTPPPAHSGSGAAEQHR